MDSDKSSYQYTALMTGKKVRLVAMLNSVFDNATLLILHFDNVKTLPKTKEDHLKNLTARAKAHGCKKQITARQYDETGELSAFWIFTDLEAKEGEKICKRWTLGPHQVYSINTKDNSLYKKSLFTKNAVPKHKFLFSPNAHIWEVKT